ncbi:hypothetical protein COPG_00007 [Colwellia phage 9A]|uniref:Uncharacterized protein n=1 Tax=Colwellia phage 9A TaxID=765765 RepID=I3UM88_9CAUD|nr:hypothetical protein COPG_00007 [Colwellia phage 9A]AFK66603.1 hypothetical protein COPG_00007 [Colwellia phage 9A]
MLSEYAVTEALSQKVCNWIDQTLSCEEMKINFNDFVETTCYTENGNPRYRLGYIRSLHGFYISLRDAQAKHFCVFGYWYESEFYTTFKASHKLTIQYNFKRSDHMIEIGLTPAQWDKLPRGVYYAANLKTFY